MTRRRWKSIALALALLWSVGAPVRGDDDPGDGDPEKAAARKAEARKRRSDGLWRPWRGQIVYGRPLLTLEERRRYRKMMNVELQTYEEQFAYWAQHVVMVQQRALDIGVSWPDVPKPPGYARADHQPIFARPLMPLEERRAYWEEFERLETEEEKEAFERAHIERMLARAEGWSIALLAPEDQPEVPDIWEGVEFPDGMEMWTTLALMEKREPVARLVYHLKKSTEALAANPEGQEKFEAWMTAIRSKTADLENGTEKDATAKILDELEEHYRELLEAGDEG